MAATKKCPFCAEEIAAEAIKCKHCGEFLDGRAPSVTVGRVDVGAEPGGNVTRSKGRITVIGYLGILIGLLCIAAGLASGPSMYLTGAGVFFLVASFLWARKAPPTRRP